MSDNLDSLLVEAFSKTLFREGIEEGEIDREDGEIDSGDESRGRHKRSKSKHKTKDKSKTKSKTKGSKSSDKRVKSDKTKSKTDNENESEVMKLLLSKQLRSYAQIEFKDDPKDTAEEEKTHKKSKHKSKKKDDEKHSTDKSKRHHKKSRHAEEYEEQNDSYYWSRCATQHEDYFYGSYYEGMDSDRSSRPKRREYSRPLSPLYETEWKGRSRSRSPIGYDQSHRRRSLSPIETNDRRRSRSPAYRDRHYAQRVYDSRRRSLSPNDEYRNRNYSRRSAEPYERIDKQKLLEIARINVIKMIESGDLPKGTDINKLKLRHLRELTTQKSVQQWTEFCRAISALDSVAANDPDLDLDSDYDSDNDDIKSVASDQPFTIRHPFKLKERKDIAIRVRNFAQLPSRTAQEMALELRQQFPVSSGNQHRRKETEWTEVDPMPPPAAPPKKAKKIETKLSSIMNANSTPAPTQTPCFTTTMPLSSTPTTSTTPTTPTATTTDNTPNTTTTNFDPNSPQAPAPEAEPNPSQALAPEAEPKADSVFSQSVMPIDIGSVMAQRLSAMRKLQTEPHNVVALKQMYQANQMMNEWAESKIVPGQFIGSTGANVLTPDQLNGPFNAWTRKDQLKTAAPIRDGMGMYLLLKMGWKLGQGLGKDNNGVKDPIMLDIKFDKKGLVAEQEEVRNLPLQLVSTGGPKHLGKPGKNPVSILHELCAKKRWTAPAYEQVAEVGPDHRKNFTFKVVLNGVEYQPSVSSGNKKQAKALAAGVCLQAFGLLPKDKS